MENKYPLGLIGPDPIDNRQYQLCEVQTEIVELPEEFDLRPKMTPVGHQIYGSCWSWGATAIKEYLDSQENGKEINLSEKFVYYNGKKISGLYSEEGDYIISALKALCNFGAPLLEDYPDTPEKDWQTYMNKIPSLEIFKKAEQYKGKTYWAVGKTLEDFKQATYQQKAPITFGMRWYESYNTPKADGLLPLPSGRDLGGHCLAEAGFLKDRLIIKNSWGTEYGDKGYIYIPFNEFEKHDIWNAYVLLDLPKLEGYVATKYLKRSEDSIFRIGDKVQPISNLNIRQEPTTTSAKVALATLTDRFIIADDKVINSDGFSWQKIRKI